MNKKTLKTLARASFSNKSLDEKRVKNISSKLSRSDLKFYIRQVKGIDLESKVFITIPSNSTLESEAKRIFSKLFPGKKIEVRVDPSLIGGVRIENNDIVYDLSLRESIADSLRSIDYEN